MIQLQCLPRCLRSAEQPTRHGSRDNGTRYSGIAVCLAETFTTQKTETEDVPELFVPAVACGRLLRQKIHYMDVGKAMVYAILYQLQFLQIQEESANAGFAPAEKACPGVEALNGVADGQVIVRP